MLKGLDKKALAGEEMPIGLGMAEQMYYQTIRSLYRAYNNGEITKEQATREKALIQEQLQKDLEVQEMYKKLVYIYGECHKLQHKTKPTMEEYRRIFEILEKEL